MDYDEEAYFYLTIMDFNGLVRDYGESVFRELEFVAPEVFEQFKVYLYNAAIEDLK